MKNFERIFYQEGGATAEAIIILLGGLFFIALLISFGLWIFGFNFGRTYEGTVKYDDCKQIVKVNSDDYWQIYFHKFTCNYIKTKSGAIMGGECVRIEKDQSYPVPMCAKAYVYQLDSSGVCTDPKYPYLGYDDMCYTTPQ